MATVIGSALVAGSGAPWVAGLRLFVRSELSYAIRQANRPLSGVLTLQVAILLALVVCLPQMLGAAPQQPDSAAPVSLDRIRKQVEKAPAIKVDAVAEKMPAGKPVATFRTGVDERVYMLPFLEYLRKEFEMTDLQRQSQEWRSKCCGFNLLSIPGAITRALRAEEAARAGEQVTRELAEIEAARKKP